MSKKIKYIHMYMRIYAIDHMLQIYSKIMYARICAYACVYIMKINFN
jgi:hypothetical protein